MKKKIVLGVTGSIAAYKAAELVRLFIKEEAEVKVVMTKDAQQFITPLTLQTLSRHPVYTDQWQYEIHNPMLHIELARWSDCILIAPASADFIARLTYGLANDLLSSLCLAAAVPIHLVPAMNQQMWLNPATQKNIQLLTERNIYLHGPDSGVQACGELGPGRMLEPEKIIQVFKQIYYPNLDQKYRVLITAGPTHEPIDPVRYIGNRSSGKMGYAIAKAFGDAGAEVTLISGPTSVEPPQIAHFIRVKTAQDMYDCVMKHIANSQVFIAAAAVADYRVEKPSIEKIKKSPETLELKLVKNPDILSAVTSLPKPPFTVGFAAETHNLLINARQKMQAKNLDMIIANLVAEHSPFDKDENEIWILQANQEPLHLPQSSKLLLADKIKNIVINCLKSRSLIPT